MSNFLYDIPLPKFNGHPISYPGWKEEMQQGVLPGRGDACAMRLLSELSPEKNMMYMFETQAEAWKHLDKLYANPMLVCGKALDKFFETKFLEGATDRAKLVSLFKLLRECHLTLKVVQQLEQLTDFHYTVGHAIDLLPDFYKDQFVEKLCEAEKDSEDGLYLTAPTRYKLLSEWLEEKFNMLIKHGLV